MAINNDEFDDLFLTEEERLAKQRQQAAAKEQAEQQARRKTEFKFSELDDIPALDDDRPAPKKKSTYDDSFASLKESIGGSLFGGLDLDSKKKEFGKKWENLNEQAEGFNKKADEAANDAMDFLADTGKKAVNTAKDLFGKAKDYAYDLEDKMREKDEAAEEALKNPKHKVEDDLLGKFDSFFEKTKNFADDLEKKVSERFGKEPEGSIKITEIDTPKKKIDSSNFYGFEDLDGDGDALIDDAILE